MGYAILEIVRGNREFSCYPVNAAGLSPDPIGVSKALSKEKLHSSSPVGSGVKLGFLWVHFRIIQTSVLTWPNLSPDPWSIRRAQYSVNQGSGVKLEITYTAQWWPNLSPGLISTADALVKSTDLIRPGVKRWRTSMLPKNIQPGTLG